MGIAVPDNKNQKKHPFNYYSTVLLTSNSVMNDKEFNENLKTANLDTINKTIDDFNYRLNFINNLKGPAYLTATEKETIIKRLDLLKSRKTELENPKTRKVVAEKPKNYFLDFIGTFR